MLVSRVNPLTRQSFHVCGFPSCGEPYDWKLDYQRETFYVCDKHLEPGERAARSHHTAIQQEPKREA